MVPNNGGSCSAFLSSFLICRVECLLLCLPGALQMRHRGSASGCLLRSLAPMAQRWSVSQAALFLASPCCKFPAFSNQRLFPFPEREEGKVEHSEEKWKVVGGGGDFLGVRRVCEPRVLGMQTSSNSWHLQKRFSVGRRR